MLSLKPSLVRLTGRAEAQHCSNRLDETFRPPFERIGHSNDPTSSSSSSGLSVVQQPLRSPRGTKTAQELQTERQSIERANLLRSRRAFFKRSFESSIHSAAEPSKTSRSTALEPREPCTLGSAVSAVDSELQQQQQQQQKRSRSVQLIPSIYLNCIEPSVSLVRIL